jgi:hypothetical protein
MGFTKESFDRKRSALRRLIRWRKRQEAGKKHHACFGGGGLSRNERRRRGKTLRVRKAAERDRWARMSASRMPEHTRISSFETDGVGLRMCLKVGTDLEAPPPPPKKKASARTGRKPVETGGASSVAPVHPNPLFAALDEGRAKLFMAAISHRATKKPTSQAFTRGRYYHEMGFFARRKWEEDRMAASEPLRVALAHLSLSGGLKNCDPVIWQRYLHTEAIYRDLLDQEFVEDDKRPIWTMSIFRAKRRSLGGAVCRLFSATTTEPVTGRAYPKDRPMVLSVGAARFASTGRGELPAPTAELTRALMRAVKRERENGRKVVTMSLDEFRTTMCCCACGAVTQPARVKRRRRRRRGEGEDVPEEVVETDVKSRRLRCCTSCLPTGKLRDRDVQGARNILWLSYAQYFGLERPLYMSRPSSKKDARGQNAG